EVVNVADIGPSDLGKFSSLIIGSSTWNDGELQDDWANFDFDGLEVSGKVVAIFGMGDSSSYSDAYCNAMGELYEKFVAKGAKIVGAVATDGYEFDDSSAVKDGKFVGLALDNDNQSDLTQSRIEAWVGQIKSELA
ncbi:MAG: flavodoxin, partial [Campylobacter sp.]|nr:flavodoxin [Campylobacter sp.]